MTEDDDLTPVAEEETTSTGNHDEPEGEDSQQNDSYALLSEESDAPKTPQDYLRQGEKILSEGNVNEALDRYREAVRLTRASGEDDTDTRVELGDAYAYSGQGLNAYRQYKRAIKQSPRKAEPYFSLGELYQRYGRMDAAVAALRQAVQLAPGNAYYRYKLGDALALFGDLEGAISELEESIQLKPQDGFYHFWLGDLYARVRRYDDAVREMQQATIFSPYDAYYNVRLGALYARLGQTRNAAIAVRQALKLTPDNAAYHCFMADFYSELKLDAHAIYHYQRAGILDDYDTTTLHRLRVLAGSAEEDESLLTLEPAGEPDYTE
jgi:tetratricopeptide (TPR) repeat protein